MDSDLRKLCAEKMKLHCEGLGIRVIGEQYKVDKMVIAKIINYYKKNAL